MKQNFFGKGNIFISIAFHGLLNKLFSKSFFFFLFSDFIYFSFGSRTSHIWSHSIVDSRPDRLIFWMSS